MSEENLMCPICGGLHPAGHRDKELEDRLEAIKTWAEEEISESSRIADAKYEEVMEGRNEAPELNYYSGKRDQAEELLKKLEVEG